MKPLIYVIVTLYMFNYVFSEETIDCSLLEPTKTSDCTDYELTENEKEEFKTESGKNADTCCFIYVKEEEIEFRFCSPLIK